MADLSDKVIQSLDKIEQIAGIPSFRENLCNLLIDTGSVIAGGFVLGSIRETLTRQSDLDIYVPHAAATKVIDYFLPLSKYNNHHLTHPYDYSFFYRNGILARFTFCIFECHSIEYLEDKDITIDVMILREDRSVIDCVSNFDFTFCEVWFDGRDVNGTHLADALVGKGTMRKEYLPVFLAGNDFTMKRYFKYLTRGYAITLQYDRIEPEYLHRSLDKKADPVSLIINLTINGLNQQLPYREIIRRTSKLITSNMDTFLANINTEDNMLEELKRTLGYLKMHCTEALEDAPLFINYQEIINECNRVQGLIPA